MRVLVVTSEWPSARAPYAGVFVQRQVARLRAMGVEVDVLDFRGARNPFNYVRAGRAVRRRVAASRPDIVHAHFGQAGLLAVSQRYAPTVVTFHGSDLYGLPARDARSVVTSAFLTRLSRIVARRADEVIVVSKRLATLISWRACRVIPMGIDTSLFTPMPQAKARQALGWPTEGRVVLFAGHPNNPVKRYDLAREVVRRLSADMPDIQLFAMLDVPPEQVPLHLNAADALLVTSEHEGGPLIVLEALACDLPVVSVDVGIVRETIGRVAGCVIGDGLDGLVAGLRATLLRQERVAGRAVACEYDEALMATKVAEVYQAVSAGRR